MPVYEEELWLWSIKLKHALVARPAIITGAQHAVVPDVDAADWAIVLQTSFTASGSLQSGIDSNVTAIQYTVYRGLGTDEPQVGIIDADDECTGSLTSLPPNCAALVKKGTGLGGRRNRGRMYIPWINSESGVDESGHINSGDLTFIQNHTDAFFESMTGDSSITFPVIANRVYDLPWFEPGRTLLEVNAGPQVTSWDVEPFIATQKRRMPRI